uniref:Uncharacterized protein n=1 Tax=Glossina palpalis gambiensis TaxID=67801 RepID=A0A1B0BMC9_9MUSC
MYRLKCNDLDGNVSLKNKNSHNLFNLSFASSKLMLPPLSNRDRVACYGGAMQITQRICSFRKIGILCRILLCPGGVASFIHDSKSYDKKEMLF